MAALDSKNAKDSSRQALAYKPMAKAETTSGPNPELLLSKADAPVSVTGEKSVAGRKKMKGGEKWDMATGKEAAMVVDKEGTSKESEKKETQEEHDIEVELNSILKKGPSKSPFNPRNTMRINRSAFCLVIIFSKSYCPYSTKAKTILLEKYTIVPAPYVVELDQHPLGAGLQAALSTSTGRRTVPNVLINGKSIGGGDDVEALHTSGELINKVKTMGLKRIIEVKLAS